MIPPEFPNKPSFWSVQLASVYLLIQADRKVPLLEWEARPPLQPGPDREVLGAANQLLQAFLLGPMDPGLGCLREDSQGQAILPWTLGTQGLPNATVKV